MQRFSDARASVLCFVVVFLVPCISITVLLLFTTPFSALVANLRLFTATGTSLHLDCRSQPGFNVGIQLYTARFKCKNVVFAPFALLDGRNRILWPIFSIANDACSKANKLSTGIVDI